MPTDGGFGDVALRCGRKRVRKAIRRPTDKSREYTVLTIRFSVGQDGGFGEEGETYIVRKIFSIGTYSHSLVLPLLPIGDRPPLGLASIVNCEVEKMQGPWLYNVHVEVQL